jgi:hypothetical protein
MMMFIMVLFWHTPDWAVAEAMSDLKDDSRRDGNDFSSQERLETSPINSTLVPR